MCEGELSLLFCVGRIYFVFKGMLLFSMCVLTRGEPTFFRVETIACLFLLEENILFDGTLSHCFDWRRTSFLFVSGETTAYWCNLKT